MVLDLPSVHSPGHCLYRADLLRNDNSINMKPVQFDPNNVILIKNEDFQELPANEYRGPISGELLTCWELTDEEIETITKERRIYISQLTSINKYNAMMPYAGYPLHLKPESHE